jgi:hypothetical protein
MRPVLCTTLLHCTDIDKKNVSGPSQPSRHLYGDGVIFIGKAKQSVVAAVACRDHVGQPINLYKPEDDGKDPIHSYQHEHGGSGGKKPFPCSTLESTGAVSLQKTLRKEEHVSD